MTDSERRKDSPSWRTPFEIASTLVMIALAGALVWQGRPQPAGRRTALPQPPLPSEPIPIGAAPVRGVGSPSVAIVEYADFECSFCVRFEQQVAPTLLSEYVDNGRAILVFKNLPLPIHERAADAAEAASCANRQGKFWEMQQRLFSRPSQLRDSDIRDAAEDAGLDLALYESCKGARETRPQVQAEVAEADRLKISGTPAFFFGNVTSDRRVKVSSVLVGARTIGEFRSVLDRLLGSQKALE